MKWLMLVAVTLCTVMLPGCASDERVGLTLLFLNMGHDSIGVTQFDVDGRQLGGPGALGSDRHQITPEIGGGKQMSYMPERGQGPAVPEEIVVSWMVATPAYDQAWEQLSKRTDKYSKPWMLEVDKLNASAPHYTKRIPLKPLLTPALIEQVKSDRHGTQLKLLVKINQDKVDITAKAEKWR